MFSASIVADTPTVRLDQYLAANEGPFWFRVKRAGNTWTMTWSTDGVSFNSGVVFDHPLTVTRLGPYAGNDTDQDSIPALTATVDYFRTF